MTSVGSRAEMELEAELSPDRFGAIAEGFRREVIRVGGQGSLFGAVVEDLDAEEAAFGGKVDGDLARPGMVKRVKNGFLDDAVGMKG
jgi:hypothetical protein